MKRSVLFLVSITLVVLLFPLVSLAKPIQPPPCCDWIGTPTNAQVLLNEGVSSIFASSSMGSLTNQSVLLSGITREHSPLAHIQIVNHLYVNDRKADFRISIFKAAAADLSRASY